MPHRVYRQDHASKWEQLPTRMNGRKIANIGTWGDHGTWFGIKRERMQALRRRVRKAKTLFDLTKVVKEVNPPMFRTLEAVTKLADFIDDEGYYIDRWGRGNGLCVTPSNEVVYVPWSRGRGKRRKLVKPKEHYIALTQSRKNWKHKLQSDKEKGDRWQSLMNKWDKAMTITPIGYTKEQREMWL